jgi:murein DD-endopeptidase MepM/ murein hydrolase activator NlpD
LSATVLLFGSLLVPGASAQSQEEADRERAEADRAYQDFLALQEQVDDALWTYEDIREEIFEVEYRLDRLENRIETDSESAAILEQTAKDLVVEAYISGSLGTFNVALEAKSIQEVVTGQELYERANAVSLASLDRLDAVSRELERLTVDLEVDKEHLDQLEVEAETALEQIELVQRLAGDWYEREDAEAQTARKAWEKELARRRAAEAARRAREAAARARAASGRSGVYDYLRCPQASPKWFRNDWGNRRSGGRTHKGTDIFGPKGGKVHAVIGGTLRTRTGGLGGIALWLYGDDGNAYYYAHLDRWASGVKTGTRVGKGDVIAYVGNTGNASGGSNHTHFQLHPGGGRPVNPYPTLAKIC